MSTVDSKNQLSAAAYCRFGRFGPYLGGTDSAL
jgi:hypothetical protein